MPDLQFELFYSLLHPDDVLLKGGLIVLELGELLLETCALGLLVRVVALDLFFNTVQFVSEGLAGIALFHGEHRFEGLLLRAEDLYLFLVSV